MTALEIPQRHRMVETAMDAYLDWREQSRAVSRAYRRWADVPARKAESAWQAYEAAHAAEENASLRYLELARRTAASGTTAGLAMSRGGHR
jgi:hypothetical protein